MPKISILIPAYNAGKCIDRSLDSALGQTFSDIEIVVVDDGSQDNTLEVLDRYASSDNRVKVVRHPRNLGVFMARETLINNSSSDHLMFLDSDDALKPDACENLYSEALRSGADLVIGGYELCWNDGRKVVKNNELNYGNGPYGVAMAMLKGELKRYLHSKLFEKRLFVENPPEYLEHFNLCEDEIMSFSASKNVHNAVRVSGVVYEYWQVDGSLTHSGGPKLRRDQLYARSVVRSICYGIDKDLGKESETFLLKGLHCSIKSSGGKNRKELVSAVSDFGLSSIISFPSLVRRFGFKKGLNYYIVTRFKFGSRLVNLYDNA